MAPGAGGGGQAGGVPGGENHQGLRGGGERESYYTLMSIGTPSTLAIFYELLPQLISCIC